MATYYKRLQVVISYGEEDLYHFVDSQSISNSLYIKKLIREEMLRQAGKGVVLPSSDYVASKPVEVKPTEDEPVDDKPTEHTSDAPVHESVPPVEESTPVTTENDDEPAVEENEADGAPPKIIFSLNDMTGFATSNKEVTETQPSTETEPSTPSTTRRGTAPSWE